MPDGFRDVFAPGVHAVASNKVSPAFFVGVCREVFFDLDHEGWDILRIVKNGNPHARFMGCDTFEAFEHFESADTNATEGSKVFGEESTPNTVGMEYRTGTLFGCKAMKEGFGTAFRLAGKGGFSMFIYDHKIVDAEMSLVFATCRDQQL